MPVHHPRAQHYGNRGGRRVRRLPGSGQERIHGCRPMQAHDAYECQQHQRRQVPTTELLLLPCLCPDEEARQGGQPRGMRAKRQFRQHLLSPLRQEDGIAHQAFHRSQQRQRHILRLPAHGSLLTQAERADDSQRHGRGRPKQLRPAYTTSTARATRQSLATSAVPPTPTLRYATP